MLVVAIGPGRAISLSKDGDALVRTEYTEDGRPVVSKRARWDSKEAWALVPADVPKEAVTALEE